MYLCLSRYLSMTPEQKLKCMSHNRAKNTGPELLLRHELWRNGFRYHLYYKKLPGTPDIVLPKYHTVIFVHGCFWHGHKSCRHYTIPITNTDFWTAKVARNHARDQKVWRELEAMGWYVIIVWECQLKKAVFEDTIERVVAEIVQNGERYRADLEKRRTARAAYHSELKTRKEKELALMNEVKTYLRKQKESFS